jgi:hypothetical protein
VEPQALFDVSQPKNGKLADHIIGMIPVSSLPADGGSIETEKEDL